MLIAVAALLSSLLSYHLPQLQVFSAENFFAPAESTVLDWSKLTVIPGLIDSHVHPLIEEKDYQMAHIVQSSAVRLTSEVTTLRPKH
jgi:predicted amidohydrolase